MPQGTIATVVIDDVVVRALEGSVTTRLNGVGTATCKLAMTEAIGGAGSMLKVYLENTDLGVDPVLWHHGRVLTCEDSADENGGYTVYNSSDPLELWNWRVVRDDDGDFSDPSIITDFVQGPAIIQAMLVNSGNGSGDALTEGPTRLQMGDFATGGVELYATPSDWPITLADLAGMLVSTGEVDIVITPIEYSDPGNLPGENNYGKIDVYNGNYGDDLSATVKFQYGMGAYNIRALRRNEDMSRMVNKLWYYLGPPKDNQHWQANITATDVDGFDDCGMDLTTVQQRILDSRGEDVGPGGVPSPTFGAGTFNPGLPGNYDVRMEVRTYDDRNNEVDIGYCLIRRTWAIEEYLRAAPLTLVHITPTRDTAIGTFSIGDLVTVEACADVRTGFSGIQRVYEYTVSWDQDSVPAIQELQVSSDNEGFSA